MRSLRGRLAVWLLVGSGLLLAAGGLLLNRLISARLLREYDAVLIDHTRSLMALTEQEGGKVWLEFADEVMPALDRKHKPDYFELWLDDGSVLERSRSLGARDLTRSGAPGEQPRLRDLTLPDGRPGRQAEIRFRPRPEEVEDRARGEREEVPEGAVAVAAFADIPAVTLVVAQSREDLDAFLSSLRVTLALVVLGLLAGTALLVRAAVRVGLAPLDDLARRLQSMDADSLGETIGMTNVPDELAPTIHHLDELLARLKDSFERERAFSANLAHELRTPLAELRAVTEVALRWPDDSSSWLESFHEIHGIGLQMERVVINLLALARYDGGQHTVWKSEVSLRELAESCWSGVTAEAQAKQMTFELEIPEPLTVVTDREKLALILANLFSNATAHGSPGGVVTCSAAARSIGASGEFVLRVGNPTDALTGADLPRIFDRFWRKDPARSDGRHAGLGLALVSALAELLGFEKEARLDDGRFEITLRGPIEGGAARAVLLARREPVRGRRAGLVALDSAPPGA